MDTTEVIFVERLLGQNERELKPIRYSLQKKSCWHHTHRDPENGIEIETWLHVLPVAGYGDQERGTGVTSHLVQRGSGTE